MNILFTKKITLLALLCIAAPILGMDKEDYLKFLSSLDCCVTFSQDETYSGRDFDYNRSNETVHISPTTTFRNYAITSTQNVRTRAAASNTNAHSLVIVNTNRGQSFTREQQAHIAELYPQIRDLFLVNIPLDGSEKFISSHFPKIERLAVLRSQVNYLDSSRAWDTFVQALESDQTTQEELRLLLSAVAMLPESNDVVKHYYLDTWPGETKKQ